jgi:CRISPR-associated exonuclease Cas4
MFNEDDLLPISALQHLAFCPRQWALIHLEGQWAENRLTAEGAALHERVHEGQAEARGDIYVVRGLRLRSLRLGLVGMADVVEFRRLPEDGGSAEGCALPGTAGRWRPFPIEHKRGKPKPDSCDEVQLCAQALCLEEMLDVPVPAGDLFYGAQRRRHHVRFDPDLRRETEALAARLHALTTEAATPPPEPRPGCRKCSLRDLCMPERLSHRSVRKYIANALRPDPAGEGGCDEEGP